LTIRTIGGWEVGNLFEGIDLTEEGIHISMVCLGIVVEEFDGDMKGKITLEVTKSG
jgi:hypothetical protein